MSVVGRNRSWQPGTIGDMNRLNEVIDEIEVWSLQERRAFIASIERAFGPAAAQQIRDALTARWKR